MSAWYVIADKATGAILCHGHFTDPKWIALYPVAAGQIIAAVSGPTPGSQFKLDMSKTPPAPVALSATEKPKPSPEFAAFQQHRAALAKGIAVTSAGNAGLSGTYSLSDDAFAALERLVRDALEPMIGLPAGFAGYPDAMGTVKPHSRDSLVSLYRVCRDLRAALRKTRDALIAGGTATWPTQSATIV